MTSWIVHQADRSDLFCQSMNDDVILVLAKNTINPVKLVALLRGLRIWTRYELKILFKQWYHNGANPLAMSLKDHISRI